MQDAADKNRRLRVLIAEDDPGFRSTLAKVLKWRDIDVCVAENGMIAKSMFDLERDFDVVISDIEMPELNGLDLTRHIRTQSQTPVILMSGYSTYVAADQDLTGSISFLKKPFGSKAIGEMIERCLGMTSSQDAKAAQAQPERYCPIHLDAFASLTNLESDVYVKIADDKFVKIARRGDTIPVERMKSYREKNLEYLYVTLSDFAKYVNFNASETPKRTGATPAAKANLFIFAGEAIARNSFLHTLNPDNVAPAQRMFEDTLKLIFEDDNIFELVTSMRSHSERLFAHSIAVSIFSVMVARKLGWQSPQVLFKVCIAAFFHDVGFKELDAELIRKKRIDLTPDEVKRLETHVARGRDLMLEVKNLPEDIAIVASQHHENVSGTGYPRRLTKNHIHPIAKLVATVDRLVERVIPISEEEPEKPAEALRTIESIYSDDLDRTHLAELMRLFRLEPKGPTA